MKATRKVSRRAFLIRVAGVAVIGGGALSSIVARAELQSTDYDEGPNSDSSVYRPPIRGCRDGDTGRYRDPSRRGRGNGRSDEDKGPGSDPRNCARRRRGG